MRFLLDESIPLRLQQGLLGAEFAADPPTGQLFDLLPIGQIVGSEIRPVNPPA